MTVLATCATDEASSDRAVIDNYEYDAFGNEVSHTGTTPNNYLYRGEQFDPDLGLYYLRARYYNPLTGRFMSRDPYDGTKIIPISLHKYLYAAGDPVNRIDPRGRADLFEYAIRSSEAIPEAKLIDIYGCVANASLAAVDLMLGEINPKDTTANIGTTLGGGSAVLGCVVLMPGLNDLAEAGATTTKAALEFIGSAAGWGACAADAEDIVNGLNSLLSGSPNGEAISKSIEDLGGCVGSELGQMLKAEAE
jgi:RHS repeat-associated protein